MGDQFTLAETVNAPFVKVLDMLRLLHLWLGARPNVQAWWDRIKTRPSYTQLEEYPDQSKDDSAPHAVAGREGEKDMARILRQYRDMMPG